MPLLALLTLFLVAALHMPVAAQTLLVGTYNMRYQNAADSLNGNGWERRCPVICGQIDFEQPDVFGTQELLAPQLRDVQAALPDYAHIGVGRDDGQERGEYAAIFYRPDRLQLLHDGTFWLSETPDRPSRGWDAALPRICTWGEFEDRYTGRRFHFFNLHMDHVGIQARRESARLVVRTIRAMCDTVAFVLTGDFNVNQTDEIYQIFTSSGLLKDCYVCADRRFAENGTFNGFTTDFKTNGRIDHIFVSPQTKVSHYAVLTNGYWAGASAEEPSGAGVFRLELPHRTPSDHYPVFARIIMNE